MRQKEKDQLPQMSWASYGLVLLDVSIIAGEGGGESIPLFGGKREKAN